MTHKVWYHLLINRQLVSEDAEYDARPDTTIVTWQNLKETSWPKPPNSCVACKQSSTGGRYKAILVNLNCICNKKKTLKGKSHCAPAIQFTINASTVMCVADIFICAFRLDIATFKLGFEFRCYPVYKLR